MKRTRKIVVGATVAALGLGTAVSAGWLRGAQAAVVGVYPATWAYTDSHDARTSFVDKATDAPIGTHLDAHRKPHKARFYFTFDISQLAGQKIHQASVNTRETAVTDCNAVAPIELWRTDPIGKNTTWTTAPAERERVGTDTLGKAKACPGYPSFDVLTVLDAALGRHDRRLTLELRIPAAREGDPHLGRYLVNRPVLVLDANHVPVVTDTVLMSPDGPCGTRTRHPYTNGSVTLRAKVSDPDPQFVDAEFALWPVNHPEQRKELFGAGYGDGTVRAQPDLSGYPHGTVLAWSVRGYDQLDYSTWTRPCYVEMDTKPPATAPRVTSATYPAGPNLPGHGGPGIPGVFRFDVHGDRDVVAYDYTDGGGGLTRRVPVRAPGTPAKVTYTPTRPGPVTLDVSGVDAAGNRGPTTEYRFWVRDTAPAVNVDVAGVGLPSHLTLTSAASDVTGFGYQVDAGKEVRIPASNGVGHGTVTFPHTGTFTVTARSYAGGKLIGVDKTQVSVDDAPTVASAEFTLDHDAIAGQSGSFTFRPRTTGVVAYLYSFNGAPEQRRTAAGDGTAVLDWTSTDPGFYTLAVRSVRKDGSTSATTQYEFFLLDPRPSVYSSDLLNWPPQDGVGVPLDVQFSSQVPGVTGYLYAFNGGAQQTVPADGGPTDISWTPDHSGANTVVVRSRFADGSLSPAQTWTFQISNAPVVSSAQYPLGGGNAAGTPGTFTFRPGLPNVSEYRYTFEGGDEQAVAAGPDGTAKVDFTPTFPGYQTVTVSSRSSDGTVSDTRTYYFIPKDPHVSVHSYRYSADDATGGIGITGTFGFSSELDDVVEYHYHLNNGPEQTVARATDGVETLVDLAPDRNGPNTLYVQSRTGSGDLSPVTEFAFLVGTAPLVTSSDYPDGVWSGGVGVTGAFAFSGGTAGIVAYQYEIDGGTANTVPADGSGKGTATFTPASDGEHTLTVQGKKGDGTLTDTTNYEILVQP